MSTISHLISAFDIDSYFNTAAKSLSAAERRTVAATDKRIGELNQLAGRFSPKRMNQEHPLDAEIAKLEQELTSDPTEETALRIHQLIIQRDTAAASTGTISAALDCARKNVIDTLLPIATKLIDSAEAAFNTAADRHRAANADSAFSADLASFNARATATAAAFTAKRRWVTEESAAGHFLLAELGITA